MTTVGSDKLAALQARMSALGVRESDLDEQFVRGSGNGGQKVNKTSSCVVLLHRSSGIQIRCQQGRSQALNRYLARRELCDRLDARTVEGRLAAGREVSKSRRQKARRSRRAKAKLLDNKRHRGDLKRSRGGNFSD